MAAQYIPARMINEYVYCPRLFYLEHVQGEWADNADTIEGKFVHRRVDEPQGERAEVHTRSIHITSETLGVTAVIDLIESEGGRVRPVDYKRGKKPQVPEGAYDPERVQVCLQALLLAERGYDCAEGVIYYVASKDKVRVRLTPDLIEQTHAAIAGARALLADPHIPPPLEDSPKCPRCSLVGICLPEEIRFLRRGGDVRPLAVSDPKTFPLVVQQPGSRVRLDHGEFVVLRPEGEVARVRVEETSQLVLVTGAEASGPVIRACCELGIPVSLESATGWFYGMVVGNSHKNVELRMAQFAAAADGDRRLALARGLVRAKIRNCRTLLRRNGEPTPQQLDELEHYADRALAATDMESLLPVEGNAARVYYGAFSSMFKGDPALRATFNLEKRTRRPPTDPVNALLSLAYSALTRDWTVALQKVGFDPLMGYYHAPRYGKPALALDLMEPFRPVVADSVVVGMINNRELNADDFFEREGGVFLREGARKRFYAAYQRRIEQEIQHPLFGYRCSYRRIFELQARLLGRWLLGEIADVPQFEVR